MQELINTFSIYNYHWACYVLGFLGFPRITLAILLSVYCPIAIGWKILACIIAVGSSISINADR